MGGVDDFTRYAGFISDNDRWTRFEHGPGDSVISTPPKCGTTWTQMLCAVMVFDGPTFPDKLDAISPWLDVNTHSAREVFATYERQAHRRVIKTHTPLDGLPMRDDVHYIVVARDRRDVFESWQNHRAIESTTPRSRALYERHGFEATGAIELPDGPTLWPIWRPPTT